MKTVSGYHLHPDEMEQEFRIIERAKQNIDAFKPLYNKYYHEIKRCIENTLYVRYSIKNEDICKDITASVFETALSKLHQYQTIHGTPFKSWLYRIMQNEINGYVRKAIIHAKHQKKMEQYLPKYDEISVFTSSSVHEVKLNYLKKYIPKLANTDQLLIQYRFFNDYSYKQIAQLTGLSENSLRTRMTRLLKKMQRYIENKGA